MLAGGDQQRTALGAYARVNHDYVDGTRWKKIVGLANGQRAVEQIVRKDFVRDVHDVGVGIDVQDDALHRADQKVSGAKIRGQRDDWSSQNCSPTVSRKIG